MPTCSSCMSTQNKKGGVSSVGALCFADIGLIEDEPNETDGLPEVILPPVEAKESFADVHIDDE